MLRCNNAGALWSGGGNRLAMMRIAWTGGLRGCGRGSPLALRIHRPGWLAQPIVAGRGVVGLTRCYSTGERSVERDSASGGVAETISANGRSPANDETPESTPDEADAAETPEVREPDQDPMLRIAKAGTSPKTREEEPDVLKGRLSEGAIKHELKWLQDPKALADRVARLLRADDLASASGLVRQAQREKRNCQVAWNHILEYSMNRGQPLAAFRFYNDMKKRGRKPNSRTYTIMLKGLSHARKNRDFNPVKTAWTIYNSISAANSAVKLNVIHSNAMLDVCARQGDMNTMWRVAGDMPEQGPGSPDARTYTIILRAIRIACRNDVASMGPDDLDRIHRRKSKAIKEGKRLWPDIVHQWTSGYLDLDSIVVHAMATLLLERGTDQDCYDVLSLFNQTSGIPVFARKPPAVTRPGRENSEAGERVADVPFVDERGIPLRNQLRREQPAEVEEEGIDHVFDPVLTENAGDNGPSYLEVGNRGLSTILDTCMTMNQGLGAGKAYWEHLTREDHQYKVEPDAASCHQYLRLLRLSRSSRAALEVIRDQVISGRGVEGKTFHIAFSVLRRDRKNINVLKIANELLALMDQFLLPDTRALEGYLDLIQVLSDNPQLLLSLNGLHMESKGSSTNLSIVGQKLQLNLKMVAAACLRPHISELNKAMEKALVSKAPKGRRLAQVARDHGLSGAHSLKVLVRARGMIDEILNSAKPSATSNEEWRQLKRDSGALKKYSDAEVFKKCQQMVVVPTDEQIMAFRERKEAAE